MDKYDPAFKGLYLFVCQKCLVEGHTPAFMDHKEGCGKEVVRIFGKRLSEAILLAFLKDGEVEVADFAETYGFPFSWTQLTERFPLAAERAKKSLAWYIQEEQEKKMKRQLRSKLKEEMGGHRPILMTYSSSLPHKPVQGALFSGKTLVPRRGTYGGR